MTEKRISEMVSVPGAQGENQLVTLHQIQDSLEALEICEDFALLSLHYTIPKNEVLPASDVAFAQFDIAEDLPEDAVFE